MPELSEDDKEILAYMKAKKDDSGKSDPFLGKNYKLLTLEERKKLWSRSFYHQIRWQAESVGGDEFYMFNPSSYKEWKNKDPRIDEILEYVINGLDDLYTAEGELALDLWARLKGNLQ